MSTNIIDQPVDMLRLVLWQQDALTPSIYSVCKTFKEALRDDIDHKIAVALEVCNDSIEDMIVLVCSHGYEDVMRHLLSVTPSPVMPASVYAVDSNDIYGYDYDEDYEEECWIVRDVRRCLIAAAYAAVKGGHAGIMRMLLEFVRPWSSEERERQMRLYCCNQGMVQEEEEAMIKALGEFEALNVV
ncbi:hypothetical protein FOA52_000975 [Chlamydomonas sp. UWO 241]|nr:hypothetical protein FOA52_000975 [Chlamydomonas sp. UWO 241]